MQEIIGYVGPMLVVGDSIKFGIGTPSGCSVDWTDCIAYTNKTEGAENIIKRECIKAIGDYQEQRYINQFGVEIPFQKFVINKVEKYNFD